MRKFSSYGLVNKKLHYYVPRKNLIQTACADLIGEDPDEGGHYITVWAPRQRGKTWIMRDVFLEIQAQGDFDTVFINLQSAQSINTDADVLRLFVEEINDIFDKSLPEIDSWQNLKKLFCKPYFDKPLILIIDEFDALKEDFINKFANEFRKIFIQRQTETTKTSAEKTCLLHGLALIGVRSVLGIANTKGSPFNVQRSVNIPNLTYEETQSMYRWYERESGHTVEQEVIDRVFNETQGQPGLVSWLGELLTETYLEQKQGAQVLDMDHFRRVFNLATHALPNNNILNIISKVKQLPYRTIVLEFFKTKEKIEFIFEDPSLNFLYTNGVIEYDIHNGILLVKFSSPFVQKRLFNYFSRELFRDMGEIFTPFKDSPDVFLGDDLLIKNLMRLYEQYLHKNHAWLLQDAPRRKDLRVFEAVFHFNLYQYLHKFLINKKARIWPEFPTGNGKVDLLIQYRSKTYALELKSFTDEADHKEALIQAGRYAGSLGLDLIHLVVFVESIPDEYRTKYEIDYVDQNTRVRVTPVFVVTGNKGITHA